ncbi:MAG: FeoB-associated Cys-rich membrane protein [Opitutales bacterium]|nr:FeoB-associated Cys-rich membrane protein [Opitutales bacterium]
MAEKIIISILLLAACFYIVFAVYRKFHSKSGGCGCGCGCHKHLKDFPNKK